MRNILKISFVLLLLIPSFKRVEGANIQLSVPYYSQRNYPQPLGTNPPGSKYTIRDYGCVITCISMVINAYYSGRTDPLNLNNWLVSAGGFQNGGNYVWGKVRQFPGTSIQEVPVEGEDISRIDSHLLSGHPVMVRLSNEPIKGWPEHYVLITGKMNSNYIIKDPFYPENNTISTYTTKGKPITRMVFYRGPRPLGTPEIEQSQGRLPLPGYRDGVLVKGSRPEVFVIQGGRKCWIPDPATFKAMGYDWNKIIVIPDSELERIPRGPDIPKRR